MFRSKRICMLILPLVALSGCQQQPSAAQPGAAPPAIVNTTKSEKKTLKRVIEQPAQIESFEETPLIARIPGYVGKVDADIGMRFDGPKSDEKGNIVKPGDILAKLSVPEMVEEHKQKLALVKQTEAEVAQAEANFKAADAHVETAAAQVSEAVAGKERVEASYDRWNKEYVRLSAMVTQKVIDEQTRDEALNQRDAADGARKEQKAKVQSAEAIHKETKAQRDKAKADVDAAKARVQVAQAEAGRLAAMLEYADIRAPFDCIVIRRNVHTGHFLQPGAGSGSQPIFVVARTDKLRVVVEVPENDAHLVKEGLEGTVRVQNVKDRHFTDKVARISGSVDAKSRTMRAEIDLKNDDKLLQPGMYAYVTFNVTLPDRITLPAATVVVQGDRAYCWQIANGKAVRTQLRIGYRDGGNVEVLKKLVPSAQEGGTPTWENMAAGEVVISGNLANLTEGQAVTVK
ncbi:MAG TPA: efflux RND transporter periplasmic adaptor subunit [Gemmataceae bacterium]|nr:efflux RND transporter periplasmic adaptor subunit [Gemmataceae bacterium]